VNPIPPTETFCATVAAWHIAPDQDTSVKRAADLGAAGKAATACRCRWKLSNYIERVLSAHAEDKPPTDEPPEQAKRLKRS